MLFEEIRAGGCCSYLLACEATCSGILVDPELSQIDRILALRRKAGTRLHYLVDTHTHADHFSATQELARRLGVPTVMHSASAAPYVDVRVDDGETIIAGQLRLRVLHTPGHTEDSISLVLPDRVLTGDTLLRLATGRTDLPTGNAEDLYHSLFGKLLRLDDALAIYPGHNYKGVPVTSIGQERAENPRLQQRDKNAFVDQMHALSLGMPDHLTEALRTNRTGGKTVAQLLDEAARQIAFMSMEERAGALGGGRRRPGGARRARARRVRRRPRARRPPRPARSARAAHRSGAARPERARRHLLRVRQDLDPRGRHHAHHGLPSRRRARRRHEGVARGGLPAGNDGHEIITTEGH